MNGEKMYSTLQKLSFIRLSTTDGEKKGREIIASEVEKLGATSVIETFAAPRYEIKKCVFEVTAPFKKTIEATGYGRSGSTPEGGLEADFMYVETAEEIDLVNAKGKIVMLSNGANYETYERLCKAGVAGFIGVSGSYRDNNDDTDLDLRMLRDPHLVHGKIPGVCIRMADAVELVKSNPSKVKITLEQDEGEGESANIIADVKGTEHPDEVIVYTAHYDSVVFSKGIFDNAAGSAMLLEIMEWFIKNPPKRTVRFIWCGSEERGLLGSKNYCEVHKDELEKICLCINIDLAGPVIGRDTAIVVADQKLCHAIEFLYKELGHPMSVRHDIYSSDSIPFADNGVPGVNFVRFGAPGAADCHNRNDDLRPISADAMAYTAEFVIEFSRRAVNAYMFPVPREIPKEIVDKVNKYLLKK